MLLLAGDRVWAFDLLRSDVRLLSLPPDRSVELYALMLECSLDALGLEEGQLSLAVSPEGRRLPALRRVLFSAYADGAQSGWTEATLPAALAELRIRGEDVSPCDLYAPSFETRDIHLDDTTGTNPILAVPLDRSSVLVATTAGRFFRVDQNGATLLTSLSTATPHAGGFARADGELWLFGTDGAVVRGRPETGFVSAPSLNTKTGFEAVTVDGSKEGAIELYAFTHSGVLERFDGVSWTVLDTSDPLPVLHKNDVTWIEPGRAIAVIANPNRVIRIDGASVNVDALPTSNEGPVSTSTSALGVLIGTDTGSILIDRPEGATSIDGSPFDDSIIEFMPYGPGFFVSAGHGLGALYSPRAGFCHKGAYAPQEVRPILPLADGFLLVSRARTLQVDIILVFVRVKSAPRCR
jgi:hypothetical protein